jgi:hypothetical protein
MAADPLAFLLARAALAVGACTLAVMHPLRAQAPDDPDWALRPLRAVAPPTAGDPAWNQHPIDRFVHAAAAARDLVPAPLADRRTLLRRASFTLTGLPPTAAEVAAFVADPADDDTAFARVVDRLLASPHHGEHQARHWLDLARYSDSNGLDENLAFANGWRYRDWVVRAHHDDLPFDRFVQMQVAGDLLADDPAVGLDGVVATGFLALGPRMLAEQDKEKLVLDTVDEQLDLLGRTVLGLTLGCARCHDHKFDPITARDYYALAGVFRSTSTFHDLGHVSRWRDRELATAAQIEARQQAERARDEAQQRLAAATKAANATQQHSLAAAAGRHLFGALGLASVHVEAESATATSLHADDRTWGDSACTVLHTHQGGAQFARWNVQVATAGSHQLLVRYAAAESRPMRVRVDDVEVAPQALAATTGGWLPAHQQWHAVGSCQLTAGAHTLQLDALGPHVPHLDALLLVPEPAAEAAAVLGPLQPRLLARAAAIVRDRHDHPLVALLRELAATPATELATRTAQLQQAAAADSLTALLLAGQPPRTHAELLARCDTLGATVAALSATTKRDGKAKADETQGDEPKADEPNPGEPRGRKRAKVLPNAALEAVRALLFDDGGLLALTEAELQPLLPPAVAAELAALAATLGTAAAAVPPPAPMAMCVADDTGKDLPVHIRGSHLALASDAVPRGTPAVFASFVPPTNIGAGSGRKELAAWLFAPEQGLAARVQSNRIWQRAFGQGLVRSPSNFGRRGDKPVLPDLLEWLAGDLRAHGWSQKHLWRTILLSRTWRQQVLAGERGRELDPDNRLHARGERQRLPAEAIRDAMLACAGTLDPTLGGTLLPTKDRDYVTNDQSGDAAQYDSVRRSLYLPIVRNAMYDLFVAFDYNDPSVHLEQRPQSVVATQALWLLNAPFVRQQSKALAAKVLAGGADDKARVHWLWQQVFQRDPNQRELALASDWLARGGEPLAAVADLVHTLFAANEFVYVD